MIDYTYSLRDGKMHKACSSEEELKQNNPEVCEPNSHVWRTTFVFGIYDCEKCKARKRVAKET